MANFNIFFIIPYLALGSIEFSENYEIFIATLIYANPFIAQITTLHLFNRIAQKKHLEKALILIGYVANLIQFILLYIFSQQNPNSLALLAISFICNLFTVAYMPAIKSYILNIHENKGEASSILNILYTVSYGTGTLIGGILFDAIHLNKMLAISVIISIIAIILLIFTPKIKISSENSQNDLIQKSMNIPIGHSSYFTFKQALLLQFFIIIFASSIIGMIAIYFDSLGVGSWFYGVSSLCSAIFGVLGFKIIGRMLNKYGPDPILLYGVLAYFCVFLGYLSTNLIVLFVMWCVPAYTFYIAVEYIASLDPNPIHVYNKMIKANFSRSLGYVFGVIIGGAITIYGDFHTVIGYAIVGLFCITIYCFFKILISRKNT